jgi:4-aminobutyrate aminotransferase
VVPDPEFLPRLRQICDRHGILLVADEVQSGAGRTGKMWAIEHWGVEPDILVTAKGIASGMPIGAIMARTDRMTWGPGAHGSTYGGNPVALVAMIETIKLLEEGLITNAAERGAQAIAALQPLAERFPAIVKDVRGLGLMLGVQFDSGDTAEAVQLAAFRRGVLVLQAGDDCVRISPPLVITADEIDTGVRIFTEAVEEVARDRVGALAEVYEAAARGQLEPTLQTGS